MRQQPYSSSGVVAISLFQQYMAHLRLTKEYIFCHNDLSQQNIIVDPHSLKIRVIIDWEYVGFYPENFETHFYKRLGPSVAFQEEHDDAGELLEFLKPN